LNIKDDFESECFFIFKRRGPKDVPFFRAMSFKGLYDLVLI